ncbi:MAG: hypothetical protein LBV23_05200 [Deltaproteobacteria bacterium]|jgi:hypothetical protein|nr:hypothetical protein [Deltaproteobacteria bacterium]
MTQLPNDNSSLPKTDRASEQHKPSRDQALETVIVRLFDRDYRFKSNRPDLVKEIAELVNSERDLCKQLSPDSIHNLDLVAHASFRLARHLLRLYKENLELRALLDDAEERVHKMSHFLDLGLKE